MQFQPGDKLPASIVNELTRLLDMQAGVGLGMNRDGIQLDRQAIQRVARRRLRKDEFDAVIDSSTAIATGGETQRWKYSLKLLKGEWHWNSSDEIVEYVIDETQSAIDATNPIEQRTTAQYEKQGGCGSVPEGYVSLSGYIKRGPIPDGTPVRAKFIRTDEVGENEGTPRAIILHVLGQTHLCGYCPEDEPA